MFLRWRFGSVHLFSLGFPLPKTAKSYEGLDLDLDRLENAIKSCPVKAISYNESKKNVAILFYAWRLSSPKDKESQRPAFAICKCWPLVLFHRIGRTQMIYQS